MVSYYDFAGNTYHNGHIIVLDAVAKATESIFNLLYEKKFPISKITPISTYGGNDKLSMADNNTSAYNYRKITGTDTAGKFSLHAYGLAIDINPIQNPYINQKDRPPVILPTSGKKYTQRQPLKRGMIDELSNVFVEHGFTIWGGAWHVPCDYQHFQTSRFLANLLAGLNSEDAAIIFAHSVKNQKLFATFEEDDATNLLNSYHQNPFRLITAFEELLPLAAEKSSKIFIAMLKEKLSRSK